ncbi:MAG: [Fe-Fe] hydrogenase large subunit C-terminal domain-containing protein, partial [Bacillota bacterium]
MKPKMNVLEVHDASCKDCHRCLRECSVKAIAFEDDQAKIIDEKCIYCGKCVNVCPQDAKVPRNEIDIFSSYLKSENKVAVSIAPSFAAAFNLDSAYRIVGALKEIGVDIVAETSQAAEYIAEEYKNLVEDNFRSTISTCCPAVVNLVEKHYPELISYLSPIISPMNLHAELLKKKYGEDTKVIFIGPCIAKIDEADTHEGKYKIDSVLTFDYLKEFLREKSISPYDSKKINFDEPCFTNASSYPLERG